MDSTTQTPTDASTAAIQTNGKESIVDSFLIEALQNPRHRLTILRMELDIQKFLQNPNQQRFEFQHLPTSYLRLAAHRVAQHYGLVTMVQDNGLDITGNRIFAIKQGESKNPVIRLSEISVKRSETDKPEPLKIAIRPRLNKGFTDEANGTKRSTVRSVEERKEDYEKARARIFSSPNSPDSGNITPNLPTEGKKLSLNREENENLRSTVIAADNYTRDGGNSSRVAIFRDMEKDRTDPDYDRNYERYVNRLPTNQNFNLAPFNMQTIQIPFVQYDNGFPQSLHMLGAQASLSYRPPPTNPVTNPFCAVGLNRTPRNAAYVQWPSNAMMYAHSYDQFRQAVFQVPYHHHQPLSFDYAQNN